MRQSRIFQADSELSIKLNKKLETNEEKKKKLLDLLLMVRLAELLNSKMNLLKLEKPSTQPTQRSK